MHRFRADSLFIAREKKIILSIIYLIRLADAVFLYRLFDWFLWQFSTDISVWLLFTLSLITLKKMKRNQIISDSCQDIISQFLLVLVYIKKQV